MKFFAVSWSPYICVLYFELIEIPVLERSTDNSPSSLQWGFRDVRREAERCAVTEWRLWLKSVSPERLNLCLPMFDLLDWQHKGPDLLLPTWHVTSLSRQTYLGGIAVVYSLGGKLIWIWCLISDGVLPLYLCLYLCLWNILQTTQ